MDHDDHVTLLREGVDGRVWAELGSGEGAFTLALADLLGPGASIHSIDKDGRALQAQERALRARFPRAALHTYAADFTRPLPALPELDGVVMANSLHFVRDKIPLLGRVGSLLRPGGHLVLVEYDADRGNIWVPHPISFATWQRLAPRAGFRDTRLLRIVPSRFLGRIYSALSIYSRLSLAPEVRESRAVGAFDFGPFLRLREEVRARLAADARTMEIAADEPFIREHSASSGAYVLTRGRLKVVDVASGRILRTLTPPALVGEMGPVLNKPRIATVIAEVPSTCLFLSVFALREAMADDPGFEQALKQEIESRLRGAS